MFSCVHDKGHLMPTYVYEVVEEDGADGERFEVIQPMSAEPLTKHPLNGKPVRRVITGFMIAGKWSDMGAKEKLSDKNLDRIGFTKYVRSGDGHYEKTAGKGPKSISGND
jgi:predicted nucleic acid-binding Zn ribbon protein